MSTGTITDGVNFLGDKANRITQGAPINIQSIMQGESLTSTPFSPTYAFQLIQPTGSDKGIIRVANNGRILALRYQFLHHLFLIHSPRAK